MTKKIDWKKASDKEIEKEFYWLLRSVANQNGVNDLIDMVDNLVKPKSKRSFVESWHEQDEPNEN